MVLRKVAVLILAIFVMSMFATSAFGQGAYIWIKVYGDAGAKALMHFGNHGGNSRPIDTSASLLTWKENEAPPAGPGFDAIWGGITSSQFPGLRGLIGKDFRDTIGVARKDTFDIKFIQADNSAATISFKWAPASHIAARADSMKMTVIDPTNGNYVVDMMAVDTLDIPTAGDNGVAKVRIIKYGVPALPDPVVVGVRQERSFVPEGFALNQNYPNPFNPSTKISFDIQKSAIAEVTIYNVLGQKVATLVSDEQLAPGTYSTVWNGTTNSGMPVASGVYYVKLTARVDGATEPFVAVRKLMLMK